MQSFLVWKPFFWLNPHNELFAKLWALFPPQISKLLDVAIIDVIGDAVYADPLAERKKELENATMKILSLYNDFQENHLLEIKSLKQNTSILDLQIKIIDMLKRASHNQ